MPFNVEVPNMWDYTDKAIAIWQSLGNLAVFVQAMFLIVVIIVGIAMCVNFLRSLSGDDKSAAPAGSTSSTSDASTKKGR